MFASIIASIAAGETATIIGRVKRAAIVYVLVALMVLLALIFGLLALYVWIAQHYGAMPAAIGFAVAFIVIAALLLIIHKATSRAAAKRAARERAVDLKAIAATAAVAGLPAILSRKGSGMALLVPVLGVVGYLIYKENAGPRRDAPPPPRR